MPEQPMAGEPATIEQARAHIEASRARISETLDEIEERLVEKRVALREKLDVKKRVLDEVEARPLRSVAIAAGVGFLVGMIGRGRSSERFDDDDRDELRELLSEMRASHDDDDVAHVSIGRSHPSFWQETRAQLVGALTAALVAAVAERLRPREEKEALMRVRTHHPDADAYDEDVFDDDVFDDDDAPRPRRRWPAADDLE